MLSVFPQAGGDLGVRQTLLKMKSLVYGAMLDPVIRDQAAYAMAGCDKGNRACIAASMLAWVNRVMRYVPDPSGAELLHDPRLMAHGIANKKQVYGDCDDMSLYLAALLKSVGQRPILRAVGYDGKPFSHVYVTCDGYKLDATRDAWQVHYRTHVETSSMEEDRKSVV